jgi:hypothetical protein
MKKTPPYLLGWIDTTIHDFLIDSADPPASMKYALITCLDSSFDVNTIWDRQPTLRALRRRAKPVGQGVLVATSRLLAAERKHRLFFGFDEVWFFQGSNVTNKPKSIVITGPNSISASAARPMMKWMHANGCCLGLGDGDGMNYCAKLEGIGRFLVQAYAGGGAGSTREKTRAIA